MWPGLPSFGPRVWFIEGKPQVPYSLVYRISRAIIELLFDSRSTDDCSLFHYSSHSRVTSSCVFRIGLRHPWVFRKNLRQFCTRIYSSMLHNIVCRPLSHWAQYFYGCLSSTLELWNDDIIIRLSGVGHEKKWPHPQNPARSCIFISSCFYRGNPGSVGWI